MEEGFSAWVSPHLPAMHRYAARLVDPADADDVVQEALTRAWQRWSTYDAGRGESLGWLLAIVRDKARRHRTRTKVWLPLDQAGESSQEAAAADVDLERAVLALSTRQRQVIELYYFVGADIATCATALGVAEGTIRATLHHARAELRRRLELS
ncbi:MAG: sigma-70 family RNA polymerase sigma factor [Gordonia sp. (in: high G+C Gram-positive bacteria)]|uniref:RNA polymerase sigma factor n=1 Tax=Gordonia sp. (in: high G+C Gram-positive bacteria) TaxID=84139 RepID=UPI003BB501EE